MAVLVREYRESENHSWDEFVLGHAHGSPFHLQAWSATVEGAFGYRPCHLVAEADGTLCGVLPLFEVDTLLTGRILLSSPFAVYGGVLAAPAAAGEVKEAFATYLRRLTAERGAQYLELRNAYPEQCLGFTLADDRYVTFTQPLCADERQLLERIPRKTRAAIRKSLSFGLESRIATGTGKFEDLYARNLRRLGTPCFPSKHFAGIFRHFGGRADIREVVHEGKVAAAVLTFYFRDQVIPYYGASDPEFNPLQPNNFMYFDLIRWAGSRGYGVFDFGRSKMVSGSFDFKAHWGMEMRRLPYEFLLGKRKQLPHFSPNNPRFQLAIRAWRRVPLPVARLVGPPLLRQVP